MRLTRATAKAPMEIHLVERLCDLISLNVKCLCCLSSSAELRRSPSMRHASLPAAKRQPLSSRMSSVRFHFAHGGFCSTHEFSAEITSSFVLPVIDATSVRSMAFGDPSGNAPSTLNTRSLIGSGMGGPSTARKMVRRKGSLAIPVPQARTLLSSRPLRHLRNLRNLRNLRMHRRDLRGLRGEESHGRG